MIKAVGSMTFMLQAEVEGPAGKPNVQVARMLSLDINTKDKQGYLKARPSRVLPYGLVELDWAAWGVKSVRIMAPGAFREFQLTDMTLSGLRAGHGSGALQLRGRPLPRATITANLYIEIQGEMEKVPRRNLQSGPLDEDDRNLSSRAGQLGLAVAAPKMALLTTDGLWIAEVGKFKMSLRDQRPGIHKANTDRPMAWLAIAALDDKFVVLRQTDQNGLQVALYKSNGTLDEIPPLDLKPLMGS